MKRSATSSGPARTHGLQIITDGEFPVKLQESFSEAVAGFDVPQDTSSYYKTRQINLNPLERAEQNFDETGPAIITRCGATERLKLVKNVPLEEFRYSQSVAKSPVKTTLIGPNRWRSDFAGKLRNRFPKVLTTSSTIFVAIQRQMIANWLKPAANTSRSTRRVTPPTSIKFLSIECVPAAKIRGEISHDPSTQITRSSKAFLV